MNTPLIDKFKNRELKAKSLFTLMEIDKAVAYKFIKEYHYLGDAKFFAKFSYGIFIGDELVGCSTFSNPQGISAMKSWFGLDNSDQSVLELSRLCMLPSLNGTNATSYLLGNSMKMLKQKEVKAVITLADDSRHVGSIYQVCNFKYYGLTDKKTDFFCADGRVNPRGSTKDLEGVWLPRTQKHRYCFLLDKKMDVLLEESVRPTVEDTSEYDCCNGTHEVFDKRFNKTYTCPKCTDRIEEILDKPKQENEKDKIMNYVVFDMECDGFNPTKIHCLSMNWGGEIRTTSDYDKMRSLLTRTDITLVGHNIVTFDIPHLERLLEIKVTAPCIDTLALAWYICPQLNNYGLADFGELYGIPKPKVDDWDNQPLEVYMERCSEDVRINSKLWEKVQADLAQLYDNNEALISSLMRYLSFKMHTVRLQEENPFTLDVETTEKNLAYLEGLKEEKTNALKRVMPTVGVVSKRVPPKTPHKKDGGLSAQGEKWKKLTEERGLVFEHSEPIEVINNYDEPNPNSPAQIKDWLFSIGWKPENFNEGVNGKIPTYYLADKSLCPSVLKLGEVVKSLDDLGVLKHRIGLLKGFLRDQEDGYISCGIHGLASTLRTRHSRLVNMPKPSVPYGELIRGVLTCDEGYELVDSDLASLENMIKLDLIYPLNPEKVEAQLTEDFDSHLEICMVAGLMTQDDVDFYKEKKKNKDVGSDRFHDLDKKRHQGKTVNYSAQYGVGKKKLSETLDIRQSEAKKLLDAYWVANKEAKTVASRFETKQCLGKTWVKNPYNKFWYELRSEKDRLSAVIQSTGDFITHLWAKNVTDVSGCVSLIYHDELAMIVKKGYRKGIEKMLRDGIEKVNKQLKLHIPMDISVNFGEKFSEIH